METQDILKQKIRWQVIFSFLFSWLCHSVSAQLHYSIPEEMRKDSVIANIAIDLGLDIKQLSVRRFHIVSLNSDIYFYVNLENGNLYIKNRIDRETLCAKSVPCFLNFDAVVENPLIVSSVKTEIQDINDNSPKFLQNMIKLEIMEYVSPGARFVLQNAVDSDIGKNSVQTYKLSDNEYFTLNEKTSTDGSKFPELVLEKPLDRETQNIYELILTAMDGGNPVKSGSVLIKITITDVNDNTPVFTQEIYKVSSIASPPLCIYPFPHTPHQFQHNSVSQHNGSNSQST
uniref:Cadherin domain-containing protein n=1 Tax=Leptobrachium leishanense TaxID=445787 RepID=A0A8C5MA52_9ANUR